MAVKDDAAAGAASTTDGAADDATKTGAPGDTKTGAAGTDGTKTDDTKTGDTSTQTGGKDDTGKPESKAPEKYALTLPENGHLDAQDLATIETIARSQGWTNEQAQQRVNEHEAAVAAQSAQFQEQTKADPVYGGAQLPETLKHASAALDTLRPAGTPRGDAFRALLDKSGYGNHLEVVSLLADLGARMADDSPLGGHTTGGAATPKADVTSSADVGAVLYGKS
jgi:hypothetical protein